MDPIWRYIPKTAVDYQFGKFLIFHAVETKSIKDDWILYCLIWSDDKEYSCIGHHVTQML